MKGLKKTMALFFAVSLSASLCVPLPARAEGEETEFITVGLCFGSGALPGANLKNDKGSGFTFGYLDSDRKFRALGETEETALSVVKTQNVWYGKAGDYTSYSDEIQSDIPVGCYHVLLADQQDSFASAAETAQMTGGFPAYSNGAWQVRFGAFTSGEAALAAAEQKGGTIVGTSSFGVSVVRTGSSDVLFQYDAPEDIPLTIFPRTSEGEKGTTYFKGKRYYGGFQYRRMSGGNLTVISAVGIDDYASCVISREMSSSWPEEALKAQAVCARTYYETNLGKHTADGFDICATTDCQAYYGMDAVTEKTDAAAEATKNLKAWYGGEPAKTYYFASSGGGTEDVRNVWGTKESLPYLCGVVDPYEETVKDKIAYWNYEKTFTGDELDAALRPYLQSLGYNCSRIVNFEITERTPTGNVKSILLTDAAGKTWPFTQKKATDIRGVLGLKSIRYTLSHTGQMSGGIYIRAAGLDDPLYCTGGLYAIDSREMPERIGGNPYVVTQQGTGFYRAPAVKTEPDETEDVFVFTSSGWGHSVGMSQWGAYAMAQQGKSYTDILTFYYPGIEIY